MNLTFGRDVEMWIKDCQKEGHVQQVAYSTYHNCLTQVCFTCDCVRTSIIKEAIDAKSMRKSNMEKKNCSRCESLEDCTIELSLQDENPKKFLCDNFKLIKEKMK